MVVVLPRHACLGCAALPPPLLLTCPAAAPPPAPQPCESHLRAKHTHLPTGPAYTPPCPHPRYNVRVASRYFKGPELLVDLQVGAGAWGGLLLVDLQVATGRGGGLLLVKHVLGVGGWGWWWGGRGGGV